MKMLTTALAYVMFMLACMPVCRAQVVDPSLQQHPAVPSTSTAPTDTAVFASYEQLKVINKDLERWEIALRNGTDTMQLVTGLVSIDQQLQDLQVLTNLPRHHNNLPYLAGGKIIADGLFKSVTRYEYEVTEHFKRLHHLEASFGKFRFDSLTDPRSGKTAMQPIYEQERLLLVNKWKRLKEGTRALLSRLVSLEGKLTVLHIGIADLQANLLFEQQHFNEHLFSHKHPLLSSKSDDPYYTPTKLELSDTFNFVANVLRMYTNSYSYVFMLNLVLGLLLIGWIYHNHAFMSGNSNYAADIRHQAPRVSGRPLAAAFTMLFCFSPFLYRHMPFIFSALFVLCLLISLSFLLWHSMDWKLRWRWVGIIFLFIRFDLMNLFIDVSYFERWLLAGLNIGCIYILVSSYFIVIKSIHSYKGLLAAVITLACLQQLLSIIFNLAGYFNAARIFSINSVFSVIMAMALTLSVDILTELAYMLFIRLQHHRIINAQQSFTSVRKPLRLALVIFAMVVWLVSFARTANIYM